jgi:uncharacterized protein YdeI (YjbR/CyaY-like superfamily)
MNVGRNTADEAVPQELADVLRRLPEAATVWEALPEAHRRGHVIAINRIADPEARAERVDETVLHLLEHHGSAAHEAPDRS